MRLITGSPFPWCDVTEASPYCESHATPTRRQNHLSVWELGSPRALGAKTPVLRRAVFPPEPFSSAPASPAPSGACLGGARLAGCQLAGCPGAGKAWHGTARQGGAGRPGAVSSV